ncbi:Serpentine Receptor, class BC (Class B-like) [Caenorhabditis elegans]|uniref:Serpentine Receptor, class BC (Class B-like) n=1 Tax=Caenorhabditis elegans TaxID=6239 RepID=O45752_CAEEL|nr:Serpentine Receptor, class BC (Class B-like) [Caenorhabditis elegans]CAB04682.2 Serpentine Receptor, class BC (Class B-like) [Caenorhabditis elegans]|eukprot:NP_507322.2 Serpentine Receptor, class BC (class B-like) [Caenorhabditis elegans]
MDAEKHAKVMNASAIIISVIGVASSGFTCLMNIFLLKKVGNQKKELVLFNFRFILDVMFGAMVTIYLTFVVVFAVFHEELAPLQNFFFYLGLPSSNLETARSIISLAIAVERVVAAYIPIYFYKYRPIFPTFIIFILSICIGLNEDVFLFVFCEFSLQIRPNCAAFGCSINACFLKFWTSYKAIMFALNIFFNMLLGLKLFVLNKFGNSESKDLSRANCLALINAGNVCLFEFFPNMFAIHFSSISFFSFQNIGPYIVVAKLLGCAIEAVLVSRTLIKKNGKLNSISSRSGAGVLEHRLLYLD